MDSTTTNSVSNGRGVNLVLRDKTAPAPSPNLLSAEAMEHSATGTRQAVVTADMPSADQASRSPAIVALMEGDEVRIALDFRKVIGNPDIERARLTINAVRNGKGAKFVHAVSSALALKLLRIVITDASPDGDLDRIANRFFVAGLA